MFAATFLVLGVPSLVAQTGADPRQRIDRTLQQAAAAGIPTSLLESKVAEGRAKGVAMEQIAVAVENRLAALTRARTVMNLREWRPADLAVGADALQAGVSEQALRTLSQGAPPAQRAAAIVVLTHLVQQGEDSQQALTQVQAAVARGPEALRNLPAEAAAARERRGPPEGRRGRPPQAGNPGNSANAPGRQAGGPPAAVPAPGRGVGSENPKKDKDKPGRPNPPGRP